MRILSLDASFMTIAAVGPRYARHTSPEPAQCAGLEEAALVPTIRSDGPIDRWRRVCSCRPTGRRSGTGAWTDADAVYQPSDRQPRRDADLRSATGSVIGARGQSIRAPGDPGRIGPSAADRCATEQRSAAASGRPARRVWTTAGVGRASPRIHLAEHAPDVRFRR